MLRNISIKTPYRAERHSFLLLLNVSDYRPVGEQEPYEFARKHVKDMLLNLKQVVFMKDLKDGMYERAVKKNEIKFY